MCLNYTDNFKIPVVRLTESVYFVTFALHVLFFLL